MGLLKHLPTRSRNKDINTPPVPSSSPAQQAYRGRDLSKRLPDKVLARIFSFVCPHTADFTYEPCEQSQVGEGCMLCDLRDLSNCARTCKQWYALAQPLLYTGIRIDPVHYCELEEVLSEKRKKAKSFRKSAIDPGEIPNIRLSLLCRTLRAQPALAAHTRILKIPYMTRESAKGDLARAVAVLPNLLYVDLPEGFFSDDPSCLPLRQELQARCPAIRKMAYRAGSEEALQLLTRRMWQSIEVLELSSLALDLATLRIVLGSLPTLQHLTLSDMSWVDDSIFQPSPGHLPDFPALSFLTLAEVPHVTTQGLHLWLQTPHVRSVLSSLTLQNTGVAVPDLNAILEPATSLQHLSIACTVSKPLALSTQHLAPIASPSLHTLNYEIVSSEDAHGLQKPADSYYLYLASSLHQSALPALTTLYVRDQTFPELLVRPIIPAAQFEPRADRNLLAPPSPHGPAPRSGGGGLTQTLEVFSKGLDELEWVFTSVAPPPVSPDHPNRGSILVGGRPLSAYSASRGLGPQWAQGGFGGEARKSVVVGNGFGGFLAVPQEEVPRPRTADSPRPSSGWKANSPNPPWSSDGPEHNRSSFLKLPSAIGGGAPHDKKGNRHDLWR